MRKTLTLIALWAIIGFGAETEIIEAGKTGIASYYAKKFEGRKAADGSRFSNKKMTAASNQFDLGDTVRVINVMTNEEVTVVITDRMGNQTRLIDLSQAAAKKLGLIKKGLGKVKVIRLGAYNG